MFYSLPLNKISSYVFNEKINGRLMTEVWDLGGYGLKVQKHIAQGAASFALVLCAFDLSGRTCLNPKFE